MAAQFNLPVTATSKSVHTRPAALLDPENVDVALELSSLSGIKAETLRYFICTSGKRGHL